MLRALVVGEYWNLGRSTEQSTSASERIKSAAQTKNVPIHFHDISSQRFPNLVAIGVNISLFTEINRDQTTVHNDLDVICYWYKRHHYKRAQWCCFIEMLLAL